jgi:hypothetical protein
MTFVTNGNLRLETTGFGLNGSGGYNSCTDAEYATTLPRNFLVDFNAIRLQWAGHFHFLVFYKQSSDALPARNPTSGVFSTNRSLALRTDDLQMTSSGSSFNPYGLETNAVIHPAFAIQLAAPAGDPTTTHRYGISLSNNIAGFYLDGTLIGSTNISAFIYTLSPPNIGITAYSNAPVVIFPTATGTNFVVQMATNLASPVWVAVTNGVPFTGIQITNPPPNAFFRLN